MNELVQKESYEGGMTGGMQAGSPVPHTLPRAWDKSVGRSESDGVVEVVAVHFFQLLICQTV